MRTQILLTIEHTKEIPDFLDKVANRIYLMDCVEDVTAEVIELFELQVIDMEPSE